MSREIRKIVINVKEPRMTDLVLIKPQTERLVIKSPSANAEDNHSTPSKAANDSPSRMPVYAESFSHRTPPSQSYIIIVVHEVDIARPAAVIRHKLPIALRALVARVGRQHALDAHADALDGLHGRPAGGA